jgi:hypothetical protein
MVLGAALVGAVWLYTYRERERIETFDSRGELVAATHVSAQPWWSVYAAVALTLAGTALSLCLLPEARRRIKRFVSRKATAISAKPSR